MRFFKNSDRQIGEAYWNGASLSADGSISKTVHCSGSGNVTIQVKSDNEYDVNIDWKDDQGNVIRQETQIFGGLNTGGNWNRTEHTAYSAHFDVIVKDTSSSSSSVDGTIHAY